MLDFKKKTINEKNILSAVSKIIKNKNRETRTVKTQHYGGKPCKATPI